MKESWGDLLFHLSVDLTSLYSLNNPANLRSKKMKQSIVKTACLYLKILLLTAIASLLLSCITFSRMAEPHTARTIGKSNNEVSLAGNMIKSLTKTEKLDYDPFHMSVKYTRGLSDNFDLGMFLEKQYYSLIKAGSEGKLQFMHNTEHAFSLFFGAGLSINIEQEKLTYGYFSYIGPVYSFKPSDYYELALNVRINQTDTPPITHGWSYKEQTPDIFLLYGSVNISNTVYFFSRFGATLSLGLMYPFYFSSSSHVGTETWYDSDGRTGKSGQPKPELFGNLGLKLHTNF